MRTNPDLGSPDTKRSLVWRWVVGHPAAGDARRRELTASVVAEMRDESSVRLREVDLTEILAQQATMAVVLSTAFLVNAPALAIVAGMLSYGATLGAPDAFSWLYRRLLIRLGLTPRLSAENMAARRFARRTAAAVAISGAALVMAGAPAVGWAFVLSVVGFAGVSVRFGWCVGCRIHYAMNGRA